MSSMPTFTILGSSSGMPQGGRACSGYALEVDGHLSLIDCGGGVCSSFQRCGLYPLAVDRIFISHTHPDHCCELPLIIQMIYLAGRTEPLTVYVPEEFVDPLQAYFRAVYVIPERLPFELQIIGYEPGVVYEGSFQLKAIANKHLTGYAEIIEKHDLPNQMQCHSFLIEVERKRLLYSADLMSFDDIQPHLQNLDVAVIESNHIRLDEFISYVPDSTVKHYVLTHLGTLAEVKEIERALSAAGLSSVALASDGMAIEL